jgi:hypothetical protein
MGCAGKLAQPFTNGRDRMSVEIEGARQVKLGTRLVCIGIIAIATNSLWGAAAGWLALAVACLVTVGLTGIEQEVRRFADALIRAEERARKND